MSWTVYTRTAKITNMIQPLILFVDIDGTILKSDGSLPERIIRAVTALKQHGTQVCLASGRSWEALKPIYERLGLDDLSICYNGAWIVDKGRPVLQFDLDDDVSRYAVNLSREKQITLVSYRHTKLLYEVEGSTIDAYIKRVGLQGNMVNFNHIDHLDFTKVIFLSSPAILESVKEDMEKTFPPDKITAVYSDPKFLEIVAGETDKGRCLREICRMKNVNIEDSAAMGDGWNDLTMLESAGDAWVMANAPKKLKSRFPKNRIAASSDEEGAAIIMESMLKDHQPIVLSKESF